MGDGWCGLRKTESVPPSLGGALAPELRQRAQRPHAKANTINLPTTTRAGDRKKVGVSANLAVSPTSPPHANVSIVNETLEWWHTKNGLLTCLHK